MHKSATHQKTDGLDNTSNGSDFSLAFCLDLISKIAEISNRQKISPAQKTICRNSGFSLTDNFLKTACKPELVEKLKSKSQKTTKPSRRIEHRIFSKPIGKSDPEKK